MKKFISRLVFIVGWLLSPFTFWNDLFINIPVAYFVASLLYRFMHSDFSLLVVICYWASNAIGILMMYVSGKNIFKEGRSVLKELTILLAAIVAYSLVLAVLARLGMLKPV